MAMAADARIALPATGKLKGKADALARRKWSSVKFSNGELMGEKLKCTKIKQTAYSSSATTRICMSITVDVPGQTKVSLKAYIVVAENQG